MSTASNSTIFTTSSNQKEKTDEKPDSLCSTNVELIQLTQRWSISNFQSLVKLSKPGQCLRSQPFQHTSYEEVNWQLCLYPGGKRDENKGFVSLFLKMYAPPAKDISITAEYRLYFLSDANDKKFQNVNVGEFHSRAGKKGFGWGLRNLPRQKVLSCLRKDGSLMIHCDVEILPDLSKLQCIGLNHNEDPSNTMVQVPFVYTNNMRKLCGINAPLSDFTIIITGEETKIAVHKCILATHSPVFCAMFESAMTETSSNTIEISDFTGESVRAFVNYIYTASIDDVAAHAEELIGLADKYGLLHLKCVCEKELASRVEVDTVCDLLELADLYRADALKDVCVNLIAAYKKQVLCSPDWTALKNRNPQLINVILEQLLGIENEFNSKNGPTSAKRSRKTI